MKYSELCRVTELKSHSFVLIDRDCIDEMGWILKVIPSKSFQKSGLIEQLYGNLIRFRHLTNS